MRYSKVHLEALDYELAPIELSSLAIEEQLAPFYQKQRIPLGRLEQLTGIRSRRMWEEGTSPSEKSILSAKKALAKSGLNAEDIGCLVHCSVCRDTTESASATLVHKALNLSSSASCFDISNACLGFMNGMITVANMIELGQIRAGIVVATEIANEIIENTINDIIENGTKEYFIETFACLTLGSGSVAYVLTHRDISKTSHRLLGWANRADTVHANLCRWGPDTGFPSERYHFMTTHGQAILENGCKLALETWQDLKKELYWTNDTVQKTFCHQIGIAHRNMLFKILGLEVHKDYPTVQEYGNIGSVALPFTLSLGVEKGFAQAKDHIALFGIGSGLNCCMMGLEW
jgi:3-oxoacyl-[acyl-carrier-protein] synthase III